MLDWPSPVTVIVAVIVLVLAATIYWLMGFYDPITYTDYLKKVIVCVFVLVRLFSCNCCVVTIFSTHFLR